MGNIDILEDACAKLPHTTRKMFGGHGLFAPNGGMFAGIVTDDEIVLKLADEPTRAELVAAGGHPWVYQGKMTMKDWIVIPERFYDEPATLAQWAARAWKLAPGKAVKAAKGAARGGGKGARAADTPKKASPATTGEAAPVAGKGGAKGRAGPTSAKTPARTTRATPPAAKKARAKPPAKKKR